VLLASRWLKLLFGASPFLVAFVFIAVSIAVYPGFSWRRNALSDLGHATRSRAAVAYNLGIFTAGFLAALYAMKYVVGRWLATGLCLELAGYTLGLVAVFDEVYGRVHGAVSALFFLMLLAASIAYSIERRWLAPGVLGGLGLLSWMAFWADVFEWGAAVPEAISVALAFIWYLRLVAEASSR